MFFNFSNSYLSLNKDMYSLVDKTRFKNPKYVLFNTVLSKELDINDNIKSSEGAKYISGVNNDIKYAQAYGGHQFGHFNMLGDGRAVMLGEHVQGNRRTDIHLKGSGRTPYSRGGDGLGTLYSMLREYMISESMYHLNIPTTRTLAVLKTNEKIQRTQIEEGGLLVRTAQSHIRVGTFQYAATKSVMHVQELLEYTVKRHFDELIGKDNLPVRFLKEVMIRQIKLIVQWQSVGFIHGVMNTDNMLISGETIDYGPCAFMDTYSPETVFSSIDRNGRYKYGNQPYIGSFNIVKLAETLLPLVSDDINESARKLNDVISSYETMYKEEYLEVFSKKLGITNPKDHSIDLIDELLDIMKMEKLDFTNTFRELTIGISNIVLSDWIKKWNQITKHIDDSTKKEIMMKYNPTVIPRNHIVEDAITRASKGDLEEFKNMIDLLEQPYNYDRDIDSKYLSPGSNDQYVTYCGT